MSQTEKRLNLNGREIILVGTAHISKESIDQSVQVIRNEMPNCVAIELDEGRYESMKNPDSWKNLDIVQVLKEGKGFVLFNAVSPVPPCYLECNRYLLSDFCMS